MPLYPPPSPDPAVSGALDVFHDIDFEDINHAVNTTNKTKGRMVWDNTTTSPMFASGTAPSSGWLDAAGVFTYGPV